jgi:hypothetical protein
MEVRVHKDGAFLLFECIARGRNSGSRLVHHGSNLLYLRRRQVQDTGHPLKRSLAWDRQPSVTITQGGTSKAERQSNDEGNRKG